MDALLFALALEVVLLQLRILEGTADLRARVQTKGDRAQRDKSMRDRQTVKDVIRRSLVEIVENGEWRMLQEAVRVLQEDASYVVSLRASHEHLKLSRQTVIKDLKTNRFQWAVSLRNADHKIAGIRDRLKDNQQNANSCLCYVEKWLFARMESLEIALDVPRAPAPRLDHENRVHDELVKAFELQIKEREEMLEHWKQRYVDDTARIDDRLATKREELREVVARRQDLQKLFNLHAGEIRGWLTFKGERAARLAREARVVAAAQRVQAWWRGTMVRRALGSYKWLKNVKKSPSKGKKK